MTQRPNIICIVSDTLRTAYLGCYGNTRMHTPNIDAFAGESTIFDAAYPESLPTIPVRRALHTGRRAYPFRNYRALPWDVCYLWGWQPMDDNEDTLAENLVQAGYHTGFVTDTMPYFAPGLNFTRGFYQWEFIRGQQQDKWKSPFIVSDDELTKFDNSEGVELELHKNDKRTSFIYRNLANNKGVVSEEDTTTARVFRWATDFVNDNTPGQPFYLLVDAFDPHEVWNAPDNYYKMYADPNYTGKKTFFPRYGSAEGIYTDEQIQDMAAHYSGLVSLVDTWFGRLMDTVKRLGLWDNSVIILISDHGTNFAENPEKIMGKPHWSMYPGLMHLPLVVHLPDGTGAGERRSQLVYNHDIVATMYEYAELQPGKEGLQKIDGMSLAPIIKSENHPSRDYLTCRYHDSMWYRDEKYWVIYPLEDFRTKSVFDLEKDPACTTNIAESHPEVLEKAWKRMLEDADGDIPRYKSEKVTDAIGRFYLVDKDAEAQGE